MPAGAVPARFRDYPCEDYFRDGWETGLDQWLWTDGGWVLITRLVYRREAVRELPPDDPGCGPPEPFLEVASPWIDGVGWGYRRGGAGLWTYHPVDGTLTFAAPSLALLIDDWLAGRLTV